jgi:hydrogenase maturation protease
MMAPLVLGIGNLLMGDEAVGVHVARGLDGPGLPSNVTVIDGGTGGFHLLSCLTDYDPVIVVDATMDGKPAGTVTVTQPRYATDFPRTLTAHDIGLRDLVESAALLHGLPRMFLVTISIDGIQPMETRLAPAVASAVPRAVECVRQVLAVAPQPEDSRDNRQ